jgi:hypothetical protein
MSPSTLKSKFYEMHRNNPEYKRVDAFICSHPAANCQLFMKFGKPIIIYATTRLEFGRHDGGVWWRQPLWNEAKGNLMWRQWVEDLNVLSKNKRNVISANNLYDVMYIKFFTGIDALYIPSWCGDVNYEFDRIRNGKRVYSPYPLYAPSENSFLIGPYRTNLNMKRDGSISNFESSFLIDQIRLQQKLHNTELHFFSEIFPKGYMYEDLVKFRAIIFIPYQSSTISFFEFYRLNIPLFCPSKSLLIKWHRDNKEFMWERIYGWPTKLAETDKNHSLFNAPNPNSNTEDSFEFWVKYSDWFTFPHVQLFDSFEHLMDILKSANFFDISSNMEKHNTEQRRKLVSTWKKIFGDIKSGM